MRDLAGVSLTTAHFDRGACPLGALRSRAGGLGLLVLSGFVAREVRVAGRGSLELIGPHDLLRPWDRPEAERSSTPVAVSWTVLEPAEVAVIDADADATERLARHPLLLDALVGQAVARSRWLALLAAVVAQPRVETRLLLALGLICDRFGARTGDRLVPVRLTHERLAVLVGARRPSVTVALRDLAQQGVLRFDEGRRLRLLVEPPRTQPELAPAAAPILSAR